MGINYGEYSVKWRCSIVPARSGWLTLHHLPYTWSLAVSQATWGFPGVPGRSKDCDLVIDSSLCRCWMESSSGFREVRMYVLYYRPTRNPVTHSLFQLHTITVSLPSLSLIVVVVVITVNSKRGPPGSPSISTR